MKVVSRLPVGELLISSRVITREQLDAAMQKQGADKKLGETLVELGLVTETQFTQALSKELAVPWVSLYHVEFSRSLLGLVTREIAERYSLVPVFVRKVKKQETLYLAMEDPTNEAALKLIEGTVGMPVRPMIACPTDIRNAIRVYYAGETPPVSTVREPAHGPPPPPRPPLPSVAQASAQDAPPSKPISKPPKPAAIPEPSDAKPANGHTALAKEAPIDEEDDDEDSPDAAPEIDAHEIVPRPRRGVMSLTLLDGTTLKLPSPRAKRESASNEESPASSPGVDDALTARDLVSALRAMAHGADASEIVGQKVRWETVAATLLSVLLKKGIVVDWEVMDEFRKI